MSDCNHLCVVFRLSLPGRIVEDGREKAKFDIDKGRSHYYMMITHTMAVKTAWLVISDVWWCYIAKCLVLRYFSKCTDSCCIKRSPIFAVLRLLSSNENLACTQPFYYLFIYYLFLIFAVFWLLSSNVNLPCKKTFLLFIYYLNFLLYCVF